MHVSFELLSNGIACQTKLEAIFFGIARLTLLIREQKREGAAFDMA